MPYDIVLFEEFIEATSSPIDKSDFYFEKVKGIPVFDSTATDDVTDGCVFIHSRKF